MLYLLVKALELHGPFNVFHQIEFRAILSVLVAFGLVMAFGEKTIRTLLKLKIGDMPEFDNSAINELMMKKENITQWAKM